MACWPSVLSVLLLLGLQQQFISAQGQIRSELPCGVDNFSCPRIGNLSVIPLQCYTFEELCDGTFFCADGSDEGKDAIINSLECNLENQEGPEEADFVCEPGNVVSVAELCDGVNNCGRGGDETTALCENKCRLPYYGGCSYTRECITSEFDVNCGDCLPGYKEDPNNPGSFDCIDKDECYTHTRYYWRVSYYRCGKGRCINTEGSYVCVCFPGYVWNGVRCIPIVDDCPEEDSDSNSSSSSRKGSRSSRTTRRSHSSRSSSSRSSSSDGCRKKTRTSPGSRHTTPRGRRRHHTQYWARVLDKLYSLAI